MSRGDAPTAFMIPISRVRSSTAMTMVFAMPMAATSSATPPIPARMPRNTPKPLSICSMTCLSENALKPSSCTAFTTSATYCESSDSIATPL